MQLLFLVNNVGRITTVDFNYKQHTDYSQIATEVYSKKLKNLCVTLCQPLCPLWLKLKAHTIELFLSDFNINTFCPQKII